MGTGKKRKMAKRNFEEIPISEQVATVSTKPKRGRPTTPDDLLLATRDDWVVFLEDSWPEIGRQMRRIRAKRNGTVEDITKLFQPEARNIPRFDLAVSFYSGSVEPATPTEILRNRKRAENLDAQILHTEAKSGELERKYHEAKVALEQCSAVNRSKIQTVATKRRKDLTEVKDDLKKFQAQRTALEKKLLDQEAYVNRSELLEFLQSRRYAINPQNVANALAGLPAMKWRQSYTRCAHMPYVAGDRRSHLVLAVLLKIWDGRPREFERPPIDFFWSKLVERKRFDSTRQFMRRHWGDLKLAIDESWKSEQSTADIPYVIGSFFMRNVNRPKNAEEKILAEAESLESLDT
jgi:hypothetical protein